MKYGEFLLHRPWDCKKELGDWMGLTRDGEGFHLTKKACSVLIIRIFPAKQVCPLSLGSTTLRD
jgi:hypothetical protein